MGGRIVVILVCMLMLTTVAGSLPSTDKAIKQTEGETELSNMAYSHDIIGEFFTLTTCFPCRYSHRALKNLYKGEYHPMHYVTMVYDEEQYGGNKWAKQRSSELGVSASPTTCWDGPFKKDVGSSENVEEDMEEFNASIIACGNRDVPDLDINLAAKWLGAVRNNPADGETLVPIEQILTWTSSQMEINVEVINNDTSEYSSRIRVYVNEVNSTLWDDKWGDPYTHAFLDYAFNVFEDIPASGSWADTVIWDGYDHHTGYKEYYQNITQDNIIVTASVFRNESDVNLRYADETTSVRTGYDTDPKRYDIYFGITTPPPLLYENFTTNKYIPGVLNWETTYYWKIDERDLKDNMIYGDIWNFTTRSNDPPNTPSLEFPTNESTNIPICVNLSWTCEDPDGDDVTFDVYFGDHPMLNLEQVAWNQTENWYWVYDLDFVKYYYWYIVAWESYGLNTTGDLWQFSTEANVPPNPAEDPFPPDGDLAVPDEGVILSWNGSDDNLCDNLRFDLYFDDVDPPLTQQLWEDEKDWWEIPYPLTKYKTYYWRVDTYDGEGEFQEGNVWEFTCGDNHRPTDPIIDGPLFGGANKPHGFTFVSTDQDNHSIQYEVDWDDDNVDLSNFYPNGTMVTLNHTWSWDNSGKRIIKARAIDRYGEKSNWSEFEFDVRSKVFNLNLLELLFTRFPNAFVILRFLIGL